jgi:type I restriction enzyme, S subunit
MKNIKPYPSYKPSGIAWLGEIPQHWEVRKLKSFSSLKARIGFHGLNSTHFIEEGPYCITGTDFKMGKLILRTVIMYLIIGII